MKLNETIELKILMFFFPNLNIFKEIINFFTVCISTEILHVRES